MKIKTILVTALTLFSINSYSKEFGTLSGTVRVGGGLFGSTYAYGVPVIVALLQAFKVTDFDANKWSNEQHSVLRFLNIGGDIVVPNWSISSSNNNIEILRPLEDYQADGFLVGKQYTSYIGYYLNWKSMFSGLGFFGGLDYEWRNFVLHYPYPNMSYNKIQSLVPALGLRYRLISPMKEIEGFPINIVLEAGISYVINTKYTNSDNYSLKALNNGFRTIVGIAITTNRFGSLHVRWTKDLYNIFNKNYSASQGPLFNNVISNNFNSFSIGWAIFI